MDQKTTKTCTIQKARVEVIEEAGLDGERFVRKCLSKSISCIGTGCIYTEIGGEIDPLK